MPNGPITWDGTGERLFETGVDHGVLYRLSSGSYTNGVPWNGLTGVTESPSGAEATDLYADNIKYGTMRSAETLGGTIEAYTYPDEFAECDGSKEVATGVKIGQQTRQTFGLFYRSQINSDEGMEIGYKYHFYYGCTASPSEKAYVTVNDSPEAITFSWEFTTIPVAVTAVENAKATASMTIDTTLVDPTKLTELETILFGSAETPARLPLPDEIITLFSESGL